ncbi:MAG: beta-propeller fold lactonase family protein [Anaerolineales bacterium]|nr:beta-propeller fold lactonase family protein [Anaerolineales bacterium]
MNRFRLIGIVIVLILLLIVSACGGSPPTPTGEETAVAPSGTAQIAKNSSSSSPIAISDDDALLVVVNNLNDSITVINVAGDANAKIAEITVGDEPRSVVLTPDKQRAYITNQASATVSVIDLTTNQKTQDIPVGVEPYGIALTPDGSRAYVTNSASNTVSVIDTASNAVAATINIPGIQPRGIAITNNNGGTGQQFVYVTQFLSQPTASGGVNLDQGSEGKVFVLSTTDDAQIQGVITLAAHDTGFAADRTKFGGTATDPTFAYPNQLQAIVLKNGRGYLPNVAASPEGPVKFNVDTQAFLSVFDVAAKSELSSGTINLHAAVKTQTFTPKLFVANPWAIAFKHASNDGYVVSAASDVLVKVTLDDNGIPSVVTNTADGDTTRVALIDVGKNPRGVVINNADTRAYVMNYISKDVSVIDLSASPEVELARVQSADLPAEGSDGAKFLLGNELFNSSRGEFDEGVAERLSNEGWQSCASCHPDGLTDGVVWAFASGPRKTVPLNGTFSPVNQTGDQRILNYSAVFDEVEDFELNIRGVSGGQGLIVLEGTTDQDPNVKAFDPPNAARVQLHVNGIAAWDAIVAWTQSRIPSPVSPYNGVDPNSELGLQIAQGSQLFTQANCQACHGGAKWATNQVDFPRSSPFAETITTGVDPEPPVGQLARFLRQVGTFDPANPLEKNANNFQALGQLGYNPPSLLSIYAFSPYLHNGACLTLDCVLENQTHRDAGGVTGVLEDPAARAALVQFLISIDASTAPVSP